MSESLEEKAFKQLLWYLLVGTRGGETRGKIMAAVRKKPSNANQLSEKLGLDYKTVQHHLKILVENNVLSVVNKGGYGAVYFLSKQLEENRSLLEGIWGEFGKK